jgi:hypothetical protein
MFAVDGQQRRSPGAYGVDKQRPGKHLRLLVGEQDALARRSRGHCWRKTRGADNGGDDSIDVG